VHLAGPDVEVDAVDGRHAGKALGDPLQPHNMISHGDVPPTRCHIPGNGATTGLRAVR
jgi:hypothetical protein